MSTLGDNIKKYRKLKGITQKELAELIGKTKNVVSNWENGLNNPDADTIENIMYVLEVDANTLLGWDDPGRMKRDAEKLADIILTNEKIKSIVPIIVDMPEDDIDMIVSFIKRINGSKE